MFARLGGAVVRAKSAIMVGALVLVVAGLTWGVGVFSHLASGGFLDENSPSAQVRAQIDATFGPQDADIFVLYQSKTVAVTDPSFRAPIVAALAAARNEPQVSSIIDDYTTPELALVSADGRATYAIVKLRAGSDDQKLADYQAVKASFIIRNATVTTEVGGVRSFYDDANVLTKKDIGRAELLSMPILLLLLVLIFRSVSRL